jgi:hypothetical protein
MVLIIAPPFLIFLFLSLVKLILGRIDFVLEFKEKYIPIIVSLLVLSELVIKYVNEHANVRVHANGLRVQVFAVFYFWRFIPWDSIRSVEETSAYDRRGKPIYLIIVKKLSLWHRMIGQQYGYGWVPAILLTSDMKDYEELYFIVKNKVADVVVKNEADTDEKLT